MKLYLKILDSSVKHTKGREHFVENKNLEVVKEEKSLSKYY